MNQSSRWCSGRSPLLPGGTLLWLVWLLLSTGGAAHAALSQGHGDFPPPLSSYGTSADASLAEVLVSRVNAEPFNLVVTIIFFLAILHTFLAPMFLRLSHRFEKEHRQRLAQAAVAHSDAPRPEVSFKAQILHFFGEVEAVFGIWVIPLMVTVTFAKDWQVAQQYLGGRRFTEPVFVVVIMTIAASRPVMQLAERLMALAAKLGKSTPAAWWFSIVTIGPLLGSFITEPAAMTISALLLAEHFYRYRPATALAYATLGLLFVNVSVGGTLTHFAAPPVLMVSETWHWDLPFMLEHFGAKALAGIVASSLLFLVVFRRQFRRLQAVVPPADRAVSVGRRGRSVPLWIIIVHLLFLAWTVLNNHFQALFVGGFLFYLAFTHATEHHQGELHLRPALLVGFFLAGLVVHGGLQEWWIEPVLSRLGARPLFFAAATLTAFNDNAAITYLASLVPHFTDALKYAVVSGAVVGGGLTVIANAPNPAGQSILSRFFPDGVSPVRLFLGALVPTIITGTIFLLSH